MLDLCPERKVGLQGPLDSDRQARWPCHQHLVERLLKLERLAVLLSALKARRTAKAEGENKRIMTLQREAAQADERLKRLYRLVEDDVTDLDDILEERLSSLKAERDRATAALETAKSRHQADIRIDRPLLKASAAPCAKT